MRTLLQKGAFAIGGAWLAACAANADIGADACPHDAKCEVKQIELPLEAVDVHSSGPVLEPVWKVSQIQLEDEAVVEVDQHGVLATGPNGGVWMFTPDQGQVGVTLIDADAKGVARYGVEPPTGLRIKRDSIPSLGEVHSHPAGPPVGVSWHWDCEAILADDPRADCNPVLTEVLVFGTEADQPRRFFPFGMERGSYESLYTLFRSSDGDAVLLSSDVGDGVRKLDLEGNVLWEAPLSLEQFDELPNRRNLTSSPNLFRSGVVAPNGDLVSSIDIQESKSTTGQWAYYPSGLLHIAADGARSVRMYDGWEHASAQYPIGEAWEAFPHAMLAYDGRGRLVVVNKMLDGDLLVLRIGESSGERFRIMREDYADLELQDIAVDPAGTVYIASEGGGREFDEKRPLLCRVPNDGIPECFDLPARTYDIEAPSAGVVFALLSGLPPDELARFDF